MAVEGCAYCGELRELTRDHVPPRALFSRPRPGNLVTVPCCRRCNSEWSIHDEYFRFVIMLGIDSAKFPNESADSVRAINSLRRLASAGFAQGLLRSYESSPARLNIDRGRIEVVLHRIARGLFYHQTRTRLPQAVPFDFSEIVDPAKMSSVGRERMCLLEARLVTIGRGNFRYAFELWPGPDPFETIWLMRFYDHRTFFCFTSPN